jgi:transposase-like protein
MPQLILPVFPEDVTPINDVVSFCKREGMVHYFLGLFPVFEHPEDDKVSFRMYVSQLVVNGNCAQAEVVRAFGISAISVKRYVKRYREGGSKSFFREPARRSSPVLTPEVRHEAQALLNAGVDRSEVARRLDLKSNTLAKAIRAGRLTEPKKKR